MVGSSPSVPRLALQPVWFFLLAIVFWSVPLKAQTAGSIAGDVRDESSAVVPGAKVTVTNNDTGIARSVTTDAEGRYSVRDLLPGHYGVQAEITGFQVAVRTGLTLNVGSDIAVPMVLKVGQVTQKTEVTADAAMVETENSELAGLVDQKSVTDLPLNARSFDELISLESSAPNFRVMTGNLAGGMADNFSVNGARVVSNLYLMDGVELVGGEISSTTPGGVLGIDAGVDAIQEFKVLTGDYSAEFGKKMGGVINVATRSGSNVFHGTAYEFLRNSDVDARNFFAVTNPPLKRNQFGGSLGGPVKKIKFSSLATTRVFASAKG